jgi:hypothetical protein
MQTTVKRNSLEGRLLDYMEQLRKNVSTGSYDVKEDLTSSYPSYHSNQINTNNTTDNLPTYVAHDQSTIIPQVDITEKKQHFVETTHTIREHFTIDYTNYDATKIIPDKLVDTTYQYLSTDNLSRSIMLDDHKSAETTYRSVYNGHEILNDTIAPFAIDMTMINPNTSQIESVNNKTLADKEIYSTNTTNDSYFHAGTENISVMMKNDIYYGPLQNIIRSDSQRLSSTTSIYEGYEMTVTPNTLQAVHKVLVYKYVIFYNSLIA